MTLFSKYVLRYLKTLAHLFIHTFKQQEDQAFLSKEYNEYGAKCT